jgi:hypothetical protein
MQTTDKTITFLYIWRVQSIWNYVYTEIHTKKIFCDLVRIREYNKNVKRFMKVIKLLILYIRRRVAIGRFEMFRLLELFLKTRGLK